MKLVSQFTASLDAEEAALQLEKKGIATYVSSKRSIGIPMSRGGASSAGLWVILDSQFEDAISVLENPSHRVRSALSPSELREIRAGVRPADMSSLLDLLVGLLGIVSIIAVLVFVLTRV